MNDRYVIAGTIAVGVLLTIGFFAPALGLPVGLATATGSSMGDRGPVLNVYADTEPGIGDIVIFETAGDDRTEDYTRHRVVNETDAGYATQGDALEMVDQELGVPYATDENLLGVVVARVTVYEFGIGSTTIAAAITAHQLRRRA